MEEIEKQIEKTMKQAFYDLIDQNCSSKPDYDWLERLYSEMKTTILKYLKKDSKVYRAIDESFDEKLFSQMIRADVFSMSSMLKLVNNTFYWLKELGAPARDESIVEAEGRVLCADPKKMISTFLKEVHICLEVYDNDMRNYLQGVVHREEEDKPSIACSCGRS